MSILITGANRGIGLALAETYAAQGHKVIATTRQIDTPNDRNIRWVTLDVTKQASFDRLNQTLDGCAVDLLICNAGVYLDKADTLIDGFAPELWEKTFKANVLGPFLTVQNLLPNLQATKNPKIAFIASNMGSNTNAHGGSYIYRASKAAVTNLASNLALDLAPIGISVGAYHPGWVITDMGGASADISTEEAVSGLIKRFSELGPDTTGCFRSFDGNTLPF